MKHVMQVVWTGVWLVGCGSKEEGRPAAEVFKAPPASNAAADTQHDASVNGKGPREIPAGTGTKGTETTASVLTAKRDAHRATVDVALTEILKSMEYGATFVLTNDNIRIEALNEDCDGRLLLRIRDRLRQKVKLDKDQVFIKMTCGEFGDEIDLRTKNGCAPDLTDQLILTDAGKRRDKIAERITETMFRLSPKTEAELLLGTGGITLLFGAVGCDATTLSVYTSGGDFDCNESKLKSLLNAMRPEVARGGFIRMSCGNDGPSIAVR
jgi:hypothetical protein